MTRTPEQIVAAEVHYCVSSLVSTLAEGTTHMLPLRDEPPCVLAYQAMELCSPIDDWEEAAIQAGWKQNRLEYHHGELINPGPRWWYRGRRPVYGDIDTRIPEAATAQEACEQDGIEPYQREVFEHWIVSDWLAEQLAERGEKVDTDFAGMTVWARTTTGQGIASDSVIEAIAADMAKRYGEAS